MDGVLHALFAYVQEERIGPCLETREYRRAVCGLEENWEVFRSTLTEEQLQRLDALLEQEQTVGRLEERAVFRCGLSLGIGLGRL